MAVTRLRVPGWSVLVVLAIVVVGTVGLLLMAREAGGWTGSGVGLAAVAWRSWVWPSPGRPGPPTA